MDKTGRVKLLGYFRVIIVSNLIIRLPKRVVFVYRLGNLYLNTLGKHAKILKFQNYYFFLNNLLLGVNRKDNKIPTVKIF
jgi:hypothetical protein